jgi:hypothetical protein
MLYVFGDSWAEGAELNDGEKPFTPYLAELLSSEYKNLGMCGASLGHILQTVITTVDQIQENDTVVVVVPPDIRWYTIHDDYSFSSLFIGMPEYTKLAENLSIEWFIYHHNLFIYTIISMVTAKTKNLVLAHNYGELVIHDWFTNKIDRQYLLSNHSLTSLLKAPDWLENYNEHDRKDGPDTKNFSGKYFEGKLNHPNDLGHQQIAKILYDRLQQK